MSFISCSAFFMPNVLNMCLCASEPPVRLWPAGCRGHGEGGRALDSGSLAAPVCGGGPHPSEQVPHRPQTRRASLLLPPPSLISSSHCSYFCPRTSHGILTHFPSLPALLVLCFLLFPLLLHPPPRPFFRAS